MNDPHREGWLVFYGDIPVASINKRAGVPVDVDQWVWRCGFHPGMASGQH